MKNYTDIIRDLREDRDLKQIEIANVLGTTQQYYSKYETGEHELPLRVLVLLADFYGVSADYLLGRTDCKEGVDGMNRTVLDEHTVGKVVSDILSLSPVGRATIIEQIFLQKLKASLHKGN